MDSSRTSSTSIGAWNPFQVRVHWLMKIEQRTLLLDLHDRTLARSRSAARHRPAAALGSPIAFRSEQPRLLAILLATLLRALRPPNGGWSRDDPQCAASENHA